MSYVRHNTQILITNIRSIQWPGIVEFDVDPYKNLDPADLKMFYLIVD